MLRGFFSHFFNLFVYNKPDYGTMYLLEGRWFSPDKLNKFGVKIMNNQSIARFEDAINNNYFVILERGLELDDLEVKVNVSQYSGNLNASISVSLKLELIEALKSFGFKAPALPETFNKGRSVALNGIKTTNREARSTKIEAEFEAFKAELKAEEQTQIGFLINKLDERLEAMADQHNKDIEETMRDIAVELNINDDVVVGFADENQKVVLQTLSESESDLRAKIAKLQEELSSVTKRQQETKTKIILDAMESGMESYGKSVVKKLRETSPRPKFSPFGN